MADKRAFPGLRSVLRNGLFLSGRSWAEALLRAVYVLLIARTLGPGDYGLWSFVMTAYMFGVGAAALGMDMLISARLGRDRLDVSAFLETSLALRLSLLCVATAGLGLVALATGQGPKVAAGLFIALLAVFGRGISMWARPVFQGMERSEVSLTTSLGCRLAEVVLGVLLLLLTGNVLILLILHSASWLMEAAIAIWRARRVIPFGAPRFHYGETQSLIKAALPIGLAIACNAALLAAPILLASSLGASREAIGQLGIITQFAALAVVGVQAFLGAAIPVLSRAIERDDSRTTHYGALIAFFVIVGFGALALLANSFGGAVITGLLGAEYETAGDLLPWAFIIGGLNLLPNGFWQQQVLRQRARPGLLGGVVAVVLTLTLAVLFWTDRGLEGVLLAVACGWTARAIVLVIAAIRLPSPAAQNPT